MPDKDTAIDKLLGIITDGRDDSRSDSFRYPYEPTPYCVLERLSDSGLIKRDDTVLDYGCGKGRVGFYISYSTGAGTIGIEYDERIYGCAIANLDTFSKKAGAEFVLAGAEEYEVPTNVNRCYFFNPFSVEILHKVIARITESYYESPREILLFFYYPSDEYASYLMTSDILVLRNEISCDDLFPNDPREKIMIFGLFG